MVILQSLDHAGVSKCFKRVQGHYYNLETETISRIHLDCRIFRSLTCKEDQLTVKPFYDANSWILHSSSNLVSPDA